MKLNGLENYFKTECGKIIDFKQINKLKETPLMFALRWNKEENLNLSNEQLSYLIEHSDLKQVDRGRWSSLMFALRNKNEQNLNLTTEQWNYLFKNSYLKQLDNYSISALIIALKYNKSENLNLTNCQWKYMIDNSDLSLITEKESLVELKKIQSILFNKEILSKIDIKEEIKRNNKI